MADAADILAFWFGDDPDVERKAWFEGGPAFDDECRRFLPDWEDLRAGGREGWRAAPSSLLAYVVLADQIPRNCFREDGRAFATDAAALAAARHAVAQGWDMVMRRNERLFLYLPYEHAEDLAMQDESMRLFGGLGDAYLLEFAEKHRDLIRRFGRFPHRNAMVGRTDTAEEAAFMAAHGRGY